jgi:hypothetical protein
MTPARGPIGVSPCGITSSKCLLEEHVVMILAVVVVSAYSYAATNEESLRRSTAPGGDNANSMPRENGRHRRKEGARFTVSRFIKGATGDSESSRCDEKRQEITPKEINCNELARNKTRSSNCTLIISPVSFKVRIVTCPLSRSFW